MKKLNNELKEKILSYIKTEEYPSLRDICENVDIKSTATAFLYIKRLVGEGKAEFVGKRKLIKAVREC